MSSTPSPRTSLEAAGSPPKDAHLNGATPATAHDDDDDLDAVQRLERELERTREEKDTLAAQYRTLLSKLHTMRTTLGDKLKADAVRTPLSLTFPTCALASEHSPLRKNSTGANSCSSSYQRRTMTSRLLLKH